MTDPQEVVVVPAWDALYVRRNGTWVRSPEAPADLASRIDRMELRLEGGRTAEEDRLLAELAGAPARAWDRRLGLEPPARGTPPPEPYEGDRDAHREVVLAVADRRLHAAWDPSVHVDEAVRAIAELDDTLNRLGERLVSWAGRDAAPPEEEPGASGVVRDLLAPEPPATSFDLPPGDPALRDARRQLAELYDRVRTIRSALESSIERAMPARAPNLSALLGPLLAARLISLAGGLDRLARLPASTVQVLGAERAFFEHLRGRAPPPRHGVLFLHPEVQSAPKRVRGRVARALAGKAAIAARLDREGRPLRPELVEAFRRRSRAARTSGPASPPKGPVRRRGPVSPST